MKKITLLGGDNRLKNLKAALDNKGYLTESIGLYPNDNGSIEKSNIIILPIPTTKDGLNIFTPLTNKEIPLKLIDESTNDRQLILSCNYSFKNKNCIDYGALDSYALLNSVPTAEGAIKLAIENTPFTLWKSQVLVIGYGRVGKILSQRLKALGCNVTVSARKPSDFAMLDALCYSYISTEQINNMPLNYNIIFNTVDAEVINSSTLEELKGCLLIDLSTKGGFNFQRALELGLNPIKAPGLPSKIAPKTASEIFINTILELI